MECRPDRTDDRELALTEAQKTKVTPILTETTQAMAKVRQDTTIDRREKMNKMADIWGATKDKIRPAPEC
jgi:hypothetical protein